MKKLFIILMIMLLNSPVFSDIIYRYQATGDSSMVETITLPDRASEGKLSEVRLHLSSAATTSENFVVYVDSDSSSVYDTKLFSQDMETVQDVVYLPSRVQGTADKDDVFTFTYTNTDSLTWGLEVLFGDE